jgi:hypothetical protein
MALQKDILKLALKDAFKESLNVLAAYPGLDSKLTQAAEVFSEKASTAVDIYIKSATIIIPPGQAAGSITTTTPSPPAIIS